MLFWISAMRASSGCRRSTRTHSSAERCSIGAPSIAICDIIRCASINGKAVSPDDMTEQRAKRLVDREFNLSHAAAMPPHNTLAGGAWKADEANALSVEEGLAQTLGLKLGDTLRFDMGGVLSEGRITSLRNTRVHSTWARGANAMAVPW